MRSYRELLAHVMTSGDRLDDVTRARIWAKLAARLEPAVARPASRAHGRVLAVAAVAGVAAVVALVVHAPRRGGEGGELALVAPPAGTLVSPLGPHAEATLIGPARIVVESTGEVTAVRLVDGMLVSEFHGGPGRALRIEAAGATIEIVGTLFAIDVHGQVACVAVAHGRVRVTAGSQVRYVEGDQRLCVRAGVLDALGPIDPVTRAALDRRLASTTPSAPIAPALAPPALAPSPPPTPSPVARPPIARSPIAPAPPRVATMAASEPTPPSAPVGPDAEALYAEADVALARGDREAADRALAHLVSAVPASKLVDEALYERARIAFERRAWAEARHHLDELGARPPTSLSEPGNYLRCRVEVAANASDAAACLVAYRAAFPRSPHDREVRAMLVAVSYTTGGCAAARTSLADLARAYPDAPESHAWQTRCGANP